MVITLLLFLLARPLQAAPFGIDDYLQQVRLSNQAFLSGSISSSASMQMARAATLLFEPQLLAQVNYQDNRAPTFAPDIEGIHTQTRRASLGFAKQTDFGLRTEFLYNALVTTRYGSSQQYVPDPSRFVNGVFFRFTQPLWQNGFGRMIRAQAHAIEAQSQTAAYATSFQVRALLADAETRYWRLAVARARAQLLRESADRARRLHEFTESQRKTHLLDEADVLTAEAAVQGKALELTGALDEEREAAQSFNSARNIQSAEVGEMLALPTLDELQALAVPDRVEKRDDVKAAEQAETAASLGTEIERERLLPNLELVADTTFQVGINLVVPLDQGLTTTIRTALADQRRAAELAYQRRLFDQENEWTDLVRRFAEAKQRLSIATKLTVAQRLKFEKEKGRRRRGVTTVYQVLQYELDYLASELAKIQLEGLILGLLAQMKTFQGHT